MADNFVSVNSPPRAPRALRALPGPCREDRGLKDYLDDVCNLDRDTRTLVAREILPEQVRTYDLLADLKLTRRL